MGFSKVTICDLNRKATCCNFAYKYCGIVKKLYF